MKLQKRNGSKFQAVFLETKSVSSWLKKGGVIHHIRPLMYQAVAAAWNLSVKHRFSKIHTFESPLGKEINAQIVFALPTKTLIQPAAL